MALMMFFRNEKNKKGEMQLELILKFLVYL